MIDPRTGSLPYRAFSHLRYETEVPAQVGWRQEAKDSRLGHKKPVYNRF